LETSFPIKANLQKILRQKEVQKPRHTLRMSSLSNEFQAQKFRKAPKTHVIIPAF